MYDLRSSLDTRCSISDRQTKGKACGADKSAAMPEGQPGRQIEKPTSPGKPAIFQGICKMDV